MPILQTVHPTDKPYAPACERNRDPILAVLREHFADRRQVLEIGSGTGQHAVHFAAALPHLTWQTSDRPENLPGIRLWLDEAALPNTPPPPLLDVNGPWPQQRFDAAFSANTLHILAWAEVERLFAGLAGVLTETAKLVIYGPFNNGGRYTSESNARFDAMLRAEAAHQGIRDFEAVHALAAGIGFTLLEDLAMPANNRCLIWQRGLGHSHHAP
ncbi:MAG: DUF938 domain-containing protein [Thiobacillaceae bacterium]